MDKELVPIYIMAIITLLLYALSVIYSKKD